ncbi:hypothetical protein HMPREF1210_00272 [Paenisporosarcina sp. HGH0030]|uniref:hypothetical protein n=1 Tax=Paenisporosarcina sp. HGH0030 TaxID=1078085 RepID=UPI00034E3B0E|nr:hypothetical protein [Paenisporosarcina sp. HGH0030]EPD54286.1 hypothetical protein HMPREF1210_00272 [Paenisporosarcina sp. HGH0030]
MRLSKTFSKFSYTLAIIHGFLIGAVSIGIFAIFIQWQDNSKAETPETSATTDKPEQVEVTAPPNTTTPTQFYAKQHGVFTTADGATALLQSNPAMKSAAIVITDGKYFVWSAASTVESEVKVEGSTESFVKPFRINSAACTEQAMQKLPVFLASPDPAKFNFADTGNKGAKPKDWDSNIAAISTLSKELNVIRVQLLSHYFAQNDCLKIEL